MAEKRVLTDPNLLNIILSYSGKEIIESCEICGKTLKYQISNQEIHKPYKIYINMDSCEIKLFCDVECLSIYKKRHSNKIFCLHLILVYLFIGLMVCLLIILVG